MCDDQVAREQDREHPQVRGIAKDQDRQEISAESSCGQAEKPDHPLVCVADRRYHLHGGEADPRDCDGPGDRCSPHQTSPEHLENREQKQGKQEHTGNVGQLARHRVPECPLEYVVVDQDDGHRDQCPRIQQQIARTVHDRLMVAEPDENRSHLN